MLFCELFLDTAFIFLQLFVSSLRQNVYFLGTSFSLILLSFFFNFLYLPCHEKFTSLIQVFPWYCFHFSSTFCIFLDTKSLLPWCEFFLDTAFIFFNFLYLPWYKKFTSLIRIFPWYFFHFSSTFCIFLDTKSLLPW